MCLPIGSSSLKILCGFGGITALTGYFLFQPRNKKYFYKILIYCYVSVMVLGGVLLSLESMTKQKNLSVLMLGVLVVLLVLLIEIVYQRLEVKNVFCKVVLIFDEKYQCEVTALIDSGNGLTDPISHLPVSIIEESVIDGYKNSLKDENFRIIPFHSIGNKNGILEAYFIDGMKIKKEEENIWIEKPMIAITKGSISINKEYRMILHPQLLN